MKKLIKKKTFKTITKLDSKKIKGGVIVEDDAIFMIVEDDAIF